MSVYRGYGNIISGINDEAMKNAILTCYSVSEEIHKKLLEIENIMYNVKDFYDCDGAKDLFNGFENFKNNFAIAVENIEVYGNDLTKVRNNFHQMISDAADKLK